MTALSSTTTSAKPQVAFIGAGALGTALALCLFRRGYPICAVISRTEAHARALAARVEAPVTSARVADLPAAADLVFCCVPDDALAALVEELCELPHDWEGCTVIHTSGALSAGVLAPLAERGAGTLSFHPVQTFTAASSPAAFEGIYVGLEGTAQAWGKRLAADLGAQPFAVSAEAKGRVHLAAVVASNFFVTLMGLVDELLSTTDVDRQEGLALVRPLVEQTWRNLAAQRPEEVLTGPVARGDRETVRSHLETLEAYLPHLVPAYAALSTESVRLAVRGGKLAPDRAQPLLDVLHAALEARGDPFF